MDTSDAEADRLDRMWDELRSSSDPVALSMESALDLDELFAADAATPEPDPDFLRGLRQRVTAKPATPIQRTASRHTVGIVAHPRLLVVPDRVWSRRALLLAVAAVLAIAILSSGLTFGADGHPEVGIPTAQASAFAPTPTPAPEVTVVVDSVAR